MLVYHGTTRAHADKFMSLGFDPEESFERKIIGPQSQIPGLFVSPDLETAKRFGRVVIAIDIDLYDLSVPPNLESVGATLQMCLDNQPEPQAFLSVCVAPERISIAFEDSCPIHELSPIKSASNTECY
jgi:hypothetical protein